MNQDINNRYSSSDGFRDLDTEQKILDRSANFKVPAGKSREEAFFLLKSRIASVEDDFFGKRRHGIIRLTFVISSAAAVFVLLFGLWFLLIRSHNSEVVADKGSHLDHRLPDGSVVTINADSRIVYNMREFSRNRRIELDGEAFFEVVRGNTFLISTKYAEIKVLGTSFNVYARDDEFRVSCLTGKIAVSGMNQSIEIVPGESAIIRENRLLSYEDQKAGSVTGWIKGEFYYENSPLNLIFREIERQFNVKFVVRNIGQKYFTGSFTNNDLKNTLDIVCIPMGLIYEIGNNGKIFITEKAK